ANNLIASATQLNAPIPRAAVRARNRYSRAGHRNIADRQISGASRLCLGAGGTYHSCLRSNARFRALPRVSAAASAAIGFLTIGLILIGGWAAFRYGSLLFDPSYPALVLGSLTAIITFYTYHSAEAQRSQIRHAFGQYLAPALVEQLAQTPEKLVLGGEERDMTILFSDVRGCTAISHLSNDDPQGLTSLMHRLLTPLTNAIVGQEGTIDKYIGDAVMGFWNAPLTVSQHELKACAAALDMIERLAVLNRERQEEANAAGQP